jgi:hypothetical protein
MLDYHYTLSPCGVVGVGRFPVGDQSDASLFGLATYGVC